MSDYLKSLATPTQKLKGLIILKGIRNSLSTKADTIKSRLKLRQYLNVYLRFEKKLLADKSLQRMLKRSNLHPSIIGHTRKTYSTLIGRICFSCKHN